MNPLQASFLNASIESLKQEEIELLQSYLEFCLASGLEIEYLARCYNVVVQDTLKEQIYFKRHRRYRFSSYDEVAASVYLNPEYMQLYMHGLALTIFLWPNHRLMNQVFLDRLPRQQAGKYLEIGPGHGFNFMNAMRLCQFDSFEGIDISPKSVELTEAILSSGYFGQFTNYQIICRDFLTDRPSFPTYDAVVMGEVLEHVENPGLFLQRIREITHPESFIFITTCINAPAIDHIFLFRNVAEIESLVRQAGLSIKQHHVVPYNGLSLEETEQQQLPINIALELENCGG